MQPAAPSRRRARIRDRWVRSLHKHSFGSVLPFVELRPWYGSFEGVAGRGDTSACGGADHDGWLPQGSS